MSENRKPKSVLGPTRVDPREGWETLHNEEFTHT
jgi:hypothetical protein